MMVIVARRHALSVTKVVFAYRITAFIASLLHATKSPASHSSNLLTNPLVRYER